MDRFGKDWGTGRQHYQMWDSNRLLFIVFLSYTRSWILHCKMELQYNAEMWISPRRLHTVQRSKVKVLSFTSQSTYMVMLGEALNTVTAITIMLQFASLCYFSITCTLFTSLVTCGIQTDDPIGGWLRVLHQTTWSLSPQFIVKTLCVFVQFQIKYLSTNPNLFNHMWYLYIWTRHYI